MIRRERVRKIHNEIACKKEAIREYFRMFYQFGVDMSPVAEERLLLLQEDIDNLEHELNLELWGCSLNYSGFNWVDVIDYIKQKRRFVNYTNGDMVSYATDNYPRFELLIFHTYAPYVVEE